MRKLIAALAAMAGLAVVSSASAGGWTYSLPTPPANVVASTPTSGAGYPDVGNAPIAGGCGFDGNAFDANHSESWLAVQPGTENIVGSSKFFFEKYSTFYNFYLGSFTIPNGTPAGDNQIQGYDCVSTGTQDMPPSWTNTTDPNLAWDLKGRVYQTMLPFNAYWTNLHPDGAIDLSYSDNMGRTWTKGNGGRDLEQAPNASSFQLGHVEDKQWVAVDDSVTSKFSGRVYALWSVFNNNTTKIRIAYSSDRGATFSKAVTITAPSQTGPSNTYIYPAVDNAGTLWIAFVGFPLNKNRTPATVYVSHSNDGGVTFAPFQAVATPGVLPVDDLPNTTFRDGIVENFTVSPDGDKPGHLYLTYENWDGTQMDVYFKYSLNGGQTWSPAILANDNVDAAGTPTDQFQPSVAAGPNGAVAVAFYDRRLACPNSKDVQAAGDVGNTNWCINTSLQAYKDSGSSLAPVGGNVRFSTFTWDPMNPAQHVDGIGQMACASVSDPCTHIAFIGDYFGLAISANNIYGLFVSTHYKSDVTADEGGPVYYQQQVLATAPRSGFGTGF